MFASIPRTKTASQYVCLSCISITKRKRCLERQSSYSNAAAAEASTGSDNELAGYKFRSDAPSRGTEKGAIGAIVSYSQERPNPKVNSRSQRPRTLSDNTNTLAALRASLRMEDDCRQLTSLSSKDPAVLETTGVKTKRRLGKKTSSGVPVEKFEDNDLIKRTPSSRHASRAKTAIMVKVASKTTSAEPAVNDANADGELSKAKSEGKEAKENGKKAVKILSKNRTELAINEKLDNHENGTTSLPLKVVKQTVKRAVDGSTEQASNASRKPNVEGTEAIELAIKNDGRGVSKSQTGPRRLGSKKKDGREGPGHKLRSSRRGTVTKIIRVMSRRHGPRAEVSGKGSITGMDQLKTDFSTAPATASTANTLNVVTDKLVRLLEGVALEACRRTVKLVLIDLMKGNATTNKTKTLIKNLLQESLISADSRSIPEVVNQTKLESPGHKSSAEPQPHELPKAPPKGKDIVEMQSVQAADLHLSPIEKLQPEVSRLAYGLERVLFNPGVYQLRDPRSRVFNFDPYLQSIMPVKEFDFNALKEYITSSRDQSLISIAISENKKYTGSTSSMTSALAHFHYLLSQWRPLKFSSLSQGFPIEFRTFTTLQRAPTAIFLRWKNGTYAIDADKEFDSSNILLMLGKSMEKLLTLSTKDYERYRVGNSDQISQEEREEPESYHYTTMGDFLMRSQLDAYDPRLPGTGVFDIKTRAVVSIRMDAVNYENGLGYELKERHGKWESYEREYYDMIRAAFLKYSLQVRMGRMDGIFVAFHNTEKIFGFQYISIAEMDHALHGTDDITTGDSEFKLSIDLLNKVLNRATAKFPEQSLRLHFETRPSTVSPFMYIFAEPVNERQITEIQEAKRAQVEAFEAEMLNIHEGQKPEEQKELIKEDWDDLQARAEEEIEIEELEPDEVENEDDGNRTPVAGGIEEEIAKGLGFEETARVVGEFLMAVNSSADDTNTLEDELRVEKKMRPSENDTEDFYSDENQVENDTKKITGADGDASEQDEWLEGEAAGEEAGKIPDDDRHNAQSAADYLNMDIKNSEALRSKEREGSPTIEDKKVEGKGDVSFKLGGATDKGSPADEIVDQRSEAPDTTLSEERETARSKGSQPRNTSPSEDLSPLLAMILTVRNKVNGEYVLRPENLKPHDRWTVEYLLTEEKSVERAHNLYRVLRKRRAAALNRNDQFWRRDTNIMAKEIKQFAKAGRRRAREQEEADKTESVKRLEETYGEN